MNELDLIVTWYKIVSLKKLLFLGEGQGYTRTWIWEAD